MRVAITVTNRISLRVDDLDAEVVDSLKGKFEHENPEWYAKKRLRLPHWNIPKVIRTWAATGEYEGIDDTLTFPRGGFQRVCAALRRHNIGWKVSDRRSLGDPVIGDSDIPDHLISLYPFQEQVIEEMIAKQNCIARAPTGSGKTCICFGLIARLKVPSLILVPTVSLLEQWQSRAMKELGLAPKALGMIRGSTRRLRPITLAMPRTIASHGVDEELDNYFGLVLCDEAQLFAASTFFAAVDPFRARYRMAVSADHTRKDRKEFLIEDLFGPVASNIARKDLVKSGHVLDVEIRIIPTDFRADWYGMPEDDDGEDAASESGEQEKKHLDFNRLLDEMLHDEARNALIFQRVHRIVKFDHDQVIVFAHRREHCLAVDHYLDTRHYRSGFLIGGDDHRSEFRKTVAGLEAKTIDVGVGTYQGSGTGLDLPSIGVGIAATPIAGNRQFFGQVRGRLCRTSKGTGKTSACMYYLWDRHVYGIRHLKNLTQWNTKASVWDGTSWVDAKTYMRSLRATGT